MDARMDAIPERREFRRCLPLRMEKEIMTNESGLREKIALVIRKHVKSDRSIPVPLGNGQYIYTSGLNDIAGVDEAVDQIIALIPPAGEVGGWRDLVDDAPPEPAGKAHYINVRSVTTYRWLPYKVPQGGRKGRWQEANDYGFNNATLPARGQWEPNLPVPAAPRGMEG